MRIIDADGHVAENPSLAIEAIKRWPDHVKPSTDRRLRLMIEGRYYPEDEGPGAGCPPEHGISKAPDIHCSSPQGVVQDADRDHIDTMVLYPSLGLCAPSLEDPDFAAGFARLYNEWIADYCASTKRPVERRRGDPDRTRAGSHRHHDARPKRLGLGGDVWSRRR